MPPKANRGGKNAGGNNERGNNVQGNAGNVRQNRTPGGPATSVLLAQNTGSQLAVCSKLAPGKVSILRAPVEVTANVCPLQVNINKITQVFQYDVKFEPEIPVVAQKRFLFYNTMNLTGNLPWIAYDGAALAYSLTPFETKRFNVTEILASCSTDAFGIPFPPRKAVVAAPEGADANPEAKDAKGGDAKERRGPQFLTITPTVSYSTADFLSVQAPARTAHDLYTNTTDSLPISTALSNIVRHAQIFFCIHAEINQKKKAGMNLDERSLFEMDSFVVKHACVYRYPTSLDGYKPLGGGLYNIFGNFSALRVLERGLTLHIDIAPMPVFKRNANVVDILQEMTNGKLETCPATVYKPLMTYRAITTHLAPGKNRRVPLQLLGPRAGDVKFNLRNKDGTQGKVVTIVQYFQQMYNIRLNPKFFTFGIETKGEKQWFPIEVLQVIGGKPWNGDLSPDQTTAMLGLTTTRPPERLSNAFEQLKVLSRALAYMRQRTRGSAAAQNLPGVHSADESIFQSINIKEEWLRVPSRQLPPPTIVSNNGSKPSDVVPSAGQFRLDMKAKYTKIAANGGAIPTVMVNCSRTNANDLAAYAGHIVERGRAKGLNIQPPSQTLNLRGSSTFDKREGAKLEDFIKKATAGVKGPFLVLAVLDASSPYYGFLKRVGETQLGVVSQCADSNKVFKNLKNPKNLGGYIDNILLKINIKLGGENYSLKPQNPQNNRILTVLPATGQQNGPVSNNVPVMVIGFDVYHDPNTRSHAAFVGTYNRELTRYTSCVVQQPHVKKNDQSNVSQEMISTANVQKAVESLLADFHRENKAFPQHIVVYRDGLSDSQLPTSMQFEVPGFIAGAQAAFLNAFPATNTPYEPSITFLVAVKRHHLRFQPDQGNDEPMGKNRTQNIPGGSVIDTQIVRNDITEFYLQSQASALGTGRSTLFQVCYCSDNRVTADDLQLLTYYLTWGHQRALKATYLPSPVYYADILCYRARYYDPLWENRDAPNRDGSWNFKELHPSLKNKAFWM